MSLLFCIGVDSEGAYKKYAFGEKDFTNKKLYVMLILKAGDFMSTLKLLFSALTVAFAILGLTNAVSYDITMPITFLCLAVTMFVTAKERALNGERRSSLYYLLLGIFLIIVTVYNTVMATLR